MTHRNQSIHKSDESVISGQAVAYSEWRMVTHIDWIGQLFILGLV